MTLRLLVVFALCVVVFTVWPEIDIWLSGRFYDGEDFPLAGSDALEVARNVIWSASTLTALAALALWLLWLPLGRKASVPGRLWGWVATVYVVGPGLLVNGILKAEWGRARPAYVFDGEAQFTRPFVIADECASNCSFVSGEASAAAALAVVCGALAWPHLERRGRIRIAATLGAIAGAGGLMRVLTGRHFLSDVVFAWLFVAFVALALWHLMRVRPARDAVTLPALRADVRALGNLASRRWHRIAG